MEKDDCAVIIANEIHVSSRQGTNTFLPLRHSLHDLLSALWFPRPFSTCVPQMRNINCIQQQYKGIWIAMNFHPKLKQGELNPKPYNLNLNARNDIYSYNIYISYKWK